MRGKDINLTVLAGVEAERAVRFVREDGSDWPLENVAVSGEIWDMEMGEVLGEIECKVTEDGRIVLTYPAMGLGRYVFAVDGQGDDGEKERLMEGYIGYEEPRMLEAGEYVEEMVVMVRGDVRKVLFGRNTAWEGLYEETIKAKDEAEEAAEGAELAKNEALEALKGAQEFIDGFNEAVRNVIFIGSNGNWWIGGEDTGRPSQGKNGIAPHIGDDGYWYVGETCLERKASGEDGLTPYIGANGHWCIGAIDTGVPAKGRDGIDGWKVRRILVDSYEDIPWSGETCNGGYYYYVYVAYRAATAATYILKQNAFPTNETVLTINGVEIPLEIAWAPPAVAVGINAVDCGVSAGIRTIGSEQVIELTAKVLGEAGNNIGVSCNDGTFTIERETLSGGADTKEKFHDVYAWVEPNGWVRIGEAKDIATQEIYGLVKLGTDEVADVGAPVAVNGGGEMTVPIASHAVAGSGKLGREDVLADGAGVGVDENNAFTVGSSTYEDWGAVKLSHSAVVTDGGGFLGLDDNGRARVPWATLDRAGAIKLGSKYGQSNPIPYRVGIGATSDHQLANNYVYGGALQHRSPDSWGMMMEWLDESIAAHPEYFGDMFYSGLYTTNQFTQSSESGLELVTATTTKLSGVYIATGLGDSRENAVPNAATVLAGDNGVVTWANETFRRLDDSYSSSQVDGLFDAFAQTVYLKTEVDNMLNDLRDEMYDKEESDARYVRVGLGDGRIIHTMYKSEFDQLTTRDANAIYFVKRDV